jgi:hypothetical protein
MTEPAVLELVSGYASHAQALVGRRTAEWLGEEMPVADPEAKASDLADLVRELCDLPGMMQRSWRSTCRRIARREVTQLRELRQTVLASWSQAIEAMQAGLDLCERFARRSGAAVAGAEELRTALGEAARLRDEAFRHWPEPPTAEDVCRARDEMARGEAVDLDEAFAEMAGVSVEEWRRRAEEHGRKRRAGDNSGGA